MKKVFVFSMIVACVFAGSCARSPNANSQKTLDVVSKDTKPPEPDANRVATNNPRDTKNKKERPDADPASTPSATGYRDAPENSQASVMMNPDGSITEIRIFKDHPQIDKVEATWTDPALKNLKVYLKGGKVLTGTTDSMPNLRSADSGEILQAVGAKSTAKTGDRPRVINKK